MVDQVRITVIMMLIVMGVLTMLMKTMHIHDDGDFNNDCTEDYSDSQMNVNMGRLS